MEILPSVGALRQLVPVEVVVARHPRPEWGDPLAGRAHADGAADAGVGGKVGGPGPIRRSRKSRRYEGWAARMERLDRKDE